MLEALLNPRAVAIIGASRTPGKVGHEIVLNLIKGGFSGQIVPVNPSADEILGLKAYSDLKAYPGEVDLSIIAVPFGLAAAAVQGSLEAGARAICVITAGFKEVGAEGAAAERAIAELCAKKGARLLGPNCLGLINAHHKMNASFAKQMPKAGAISVISQSGALCTAILDLASGRRLGLAKLISMGNKADLNESDFLSALATDNETKVIVAYLESIVSGKEFVKAAEAAATEKPVVILKAGTTTAGAKAASSHTGSLAGADMAYGAAFRRSGVIRAETFEQLFDFATAFAMQPIPQGDRVAIITNAGGPGIMAADAVEGLGMQVATLAHGTATALRQTLPAAASVGNPIDVLGDADPDRYVMAVNAAQDDDDVDAIIVILTPQAMTKPAETARAIAGCVRRRKPILACFMGGEDVMPGRDELTASNLPDYPSPERAVGALRAMCSYAVWLKRPQRVVARFPVNRRRVERIIHRYLRAAQSQVGEPHAKAILRAYGFNVPPGQVEADAQAAVEAAEKIGYPVAMKIVSPEIIHKSDLGGVRLNLSSPEDVRDAFDLMMLRIRQRAPGAKIEGVYVEKMCARGREVILGISVDVVKSAAENARLVLAEVNPRMPRTLGDSFINVLDLDYLVPVDRPLLEVAVSEPDEVTRKLGENIAALVEDGATVEMGIGRIPQAVLEFLKGKKALGIHTEMFTDAIIEMVESGVITGTKKTLDHGKIVASFCMGTQRLYDYIDNNPVFSFHPTEYVNDPFIIGQQFKQVAINVALEVDLTGQVCADSLGTLFYSGIGGQVDFNRGAARSKDGKAIIALPSTTKDDTISRIVTRLSPGAGVVTTRGDVHYVVTEHGVAYLHGKSVQERAISLISIAHPKFREQLLVEAIEAKYLRPGLKDVEGKLMVGPPDIRTTMVLDDGTQIYFRSIQPTDEPGMRELFHALSQETIYYRFMSKMKRIPRKQIQDFVYIDHRTNVAIVGTVPEAHGEEIVGIGRYYLDTSTNRAEVAFVIHDRWQGRGIGTFLVRHLIRIAKRHGIAGFTAEVLRDNKRMQRVLQKSGGAVQSELHGEVYSYRLDF